MKLEKKHDLTLSEVECIAAISNNESLSSKNLSSILEVSPSRGSRIVNKLVERGFVHAQADVLDRRITLLSLTKLGLQCSIDLEIEKEHCEQRLIAQLNKDQMLEVERGLNILLKVI